MKLNLIIDASGLFYRSLFTVGNFGSKGKLLGTATSQGVFMRKLATDISAFIKSVDDLSRVIITVDSSSWRKDVFIEEGPYKGTRTKDDSVDWEAFFNLCETLLECLKRRGYHISKVPKAEADDLLYLWSRKLNAAGECVILGTGDKDMFQTAQVCDNGAWTIVLDPVNGRRKITINKEINNLLNIEKNPEDYNIFEGDAKDESDILKKMVARETVNIIDVNSVSIRKVITGDNGDAVPSVITWVKKNPESPLGRITEGQYDKAIVGYEHLTWRDLRDGNVPEGFFDAFRKFTKQETSTEVIKERLKRNVILTVLNEETIPESIQETFKETEIERTAIYSSRDQILEGTEWIKEQAYVPSQYNLF
jgi:hypothetical protein